MIKNNIITSAIAALSLITVNAQTPRAGVSYTVAPTDMLAPAANVPQPVFGSVWSVLLTCLPGKPYKSNCGTTCRIVHTGNSYSINVAAFSRYFSYVQVQPGELSLTKTEYVNVSNTVRQVLVWNFTTSGATATATCTVEVQSLSRGVWKTTLPASLWLKPYACLVNMDTQVN